ncbi:alpha/beta hydrolase [Halobacteriales archaeon QS_1_68_20]|nr:MAG: alpha/beta hydrolase [Halobacteriales archaeon QS_1_68_20]
MPRVERNGFSLYYQTDGQGETVAFVGDLGYGAWQWAWQHQAVAGPFEALTWDLRGTGRSGVPDGPYEVTALAADLEAVLADAGVGRAHLVGAGLGGLVALRYALDYDRARTLTLLGTSAGGPHLPEDSVDRLYAPADDEDALRATLDPVLTDEFLDGHPDVVDDVVQWRAGTVPGDDESASGGPGGDAPEAGWRAQASAAEGFDVRDRLYEVTLPALVIHGTADEVWPAADGEALAEDLPRGRYEPVECGPHLVGVERPRIVDDLLVGFLEAQSETA